MAQRGKSVSKVNESNRARAEVERPEQTRVKVPEEKNAGTLDPTDKDAVAGLDYTCVPTATGSWDDTQTRGDVILQKQEM